MTVQGNPITVVPHDLGEFISLTDSSPGMRNLTRLRQSREPLRLGQADAAHRCRERPTAIGHRTGQQNDTDRSTGSRTWPKARDPGALVSRVSSIRSSKNDRTMGKALRCKGRTVFRSTDENAMGKLQSRYRQHSIEYGLGQKAYRVPRVHRRPRNDALA